MKKPSKEYYIELSEEHGNFKIWIVDGRYIRGHIDEELPTSDSITGINIFQRMSSGSIKKLSMMRGGFLSIICLSRIG